MFQTHCLPMSYQGQTARDGRRNRTDPTSSRFHANTRYQRRGAGIRPNQRPIFPQQGADGLEGITVSINRHLTTDGVSSRIRTIASRNDRTRPQPRTAPSTVRMDDPSTNQVRWWRVSIPQAGTIGKDRVMSTLQAHCIRQFQAYHVIWNGI
jgi:hypothetical protein